MYSVIDGTWLEKKRKFSQRVERWPANIWTEKGRKFIFMCWIFYTARHSIFRDCTGDTLNTTYSIVHPIKFCAVSLLVCVCVHVYIKPALLIEGLIQNVVVFPLFSKGFGSSNEFAFPAMNSVLYHLTKEGTKESISFIFHISDFHALKNIFSSFFYDCVLIS